MERRLTCRGLVELLDRYLSGELAPGPRATFNSHMAACPPCVSYAKTYAEAVRLGKLATFDEAPAPEDAPDALIRAILVARECT